MRLNLRAMLLWIAAVNVVPVSAVAAVVLPFSGSGLVTAGPCSPTQTDPAECFLISGSTDLYVLDGVGGYTFTFEGELLPNPDPDAFPFPTYLGAGTFSATRGLDALVGTWSNVFFPAPPPAGCDAASPFGDPDCWTAESFALFDYLVTEGTGIYAGLVGTGTSQVDVVTGFPPGNVDPMTGTTFVESGEFVLSQVPEPHIIGLLAVGIVGRLLRGRRADLPNPPAR